MTTRGGLHRHYGVLSPAERLALIFAATTRGDDAEADRLARSAPRVSFSFPDHYGRAEGVILATLFHAGDVLELAGHFWKAQGLLESRAALGCEDDDRHGDRLHGVVRLAAYCVVRNAAAWREWGRQAGIDADAALADLPWADALKQAEEAAAGLAFSESEAREWVKDFAARKGKEAPELVTAAYLTAEIHRFIDSRAREWEQDGL